MMALPSRGEGAQQGVDLGLGMDVDAAGRLVHDEDEGVAHQPSCEQDLLLIAATQRADAGVDGRGGDAEALHVIQRYLFDPSVVQMPGSEMVQTGGGDVLGDAHFQKEAQFLAIFRKITDAGRDGIARRADSRGLALYAHFACLPGFGSENGPCKFGSPGAGQTGKSENFTGPGGEGDGPGLWAGEATDFECWHDLR